MPEKAARVPPRANCTTFVIAKAQMSGKAAPANDRLDGVQQKS